MKRTVLSFIAIIGLMSFCASAAFAVYMPPGDSPLYIKFTNAEQIDTTATPAGGELNWGIVEVTNIYLGLYDGVDQAFPLTQDPIFTQSGNAEITGIFTGITASPDATLPAGAGLLLGQGGSIYLFYDDTPNGDVSTATPGQRSGNTFTGFTDGVFLAKIDFMDGARNAALPNSSIVGTVIPNSPGFSTGVADSFGSVDVNYLWNGTDLGAWATLLDRDFFDTVLGQNTADLSFKNSYNPRTNWDGVDGVFGAVSDDPARAYSVVPEPSTFVLLGFGLLGLGFLARRRHNS